MKQTARVYKNYNTHVRALDAAVGGRGKCAIERHC
jgi:hypothetical protein